MTVRDSVLASFVAVVVALGACDADTTARDPTLRTARYGTVRSAPVVVGAEGGELAAAGVTVVIPAGALASDVAVSFAVTTTSVATGASARRTVTLEPEGLVFAAPATVTLSLLSDEAGADYEAVTGLRLVALTRGEGELSAPIWDSRGVTVGPPVCEPGCGSGGACHAAVCLATCASDADCAEGPLCGNGVTASVSREGRCDDAAGACVLVGQTVTPCARGCAIDVSNRCLPEDACAPPRVSWAGERGVCLCGFPELACTAPEGDAAWVGAACDADADCAGLGCEGLATCLRPGARFPARCDDDALFSCWYVPEAFAGPCAPLCGAE